MTDVATLKRTELQAAACRTFGKTASTWTGRATNEELRETLNGGEVPPSGEKAPQDEDHPPCRGERWGCPRQHREERPLLALTEPFPHRTPPSRILPQGRTNGWGELTGQPGGHGCCIGGLAPALLLLTPSSAQTMRSRAGTIDPFRVSRTHRLRRARCLARAVAARADPTASASAPFDRRKHGHQPRCPLASKLVTRCGSGVE